ncbi:pyruvate ferredoxin oxidoreductase subunit gamma [Candidatus Bathyarchaeota archaeon]|nr:pyruvate ferredoxin oxidoreductase subunit gamma [Candidatus Bathyarchaeota archaeon]
MLSEIRWHGRGGQGVVTASRILAQAALLEGKFVQAFPEFGPERTGAPILGFTRISDERIRIHSHVYTPSLVVVLDPTLLESVDVTTGLNKNGILVVNSEKTPRQIKERLGVHDAKAFTVDATRIALEVLGRAITNTAMLGAVVRAAPIASLDSVKAAVRERFTESLADRNVTAIERAYSEVVCE